MDDQTGSTVASKYVVCKEQQGMFQMHLNRPPMNAFNFEMVEEMNQAIAGILYRTDLKLVVISAGGKNFCGGFAPEDFSDYRSYQLIESFDRLFQHLQALNIPVLSVVQGMALGAGFELVIFSDLAIASESSKFGFPEIRIGLIPAVACNILQRYMPPKRAAELIFTGDVMNAKDAEKHGLINMAVPDDKLQEQAGVLIGKMLQYSAPILQCAKRAMTESQGKPLDEAIRAVEGIYLNQLLNLDDSKEGIAAFVEKRKPVWKNQ
jgi:cyclohexa-1,5-dienecarbonyl-CoA hydratase